MRQHMVLAMCIFQRNCLHKPTVPWQGPSSAGMCNCTYVWLRKAKPLQCKNMQRAKLLKRNMLKLLLTFCHTFDTTPCPSVGYTRRRGGSMLVWVCIMCMLCFLCLGCFRVVWFLDKVLSFVFVFRVCCFCFLPFVFACDCLCFVCFIVYLFLSVVCWTSPLSLHRFLCCRFLS